MRLRRAVWHYFTRFFRISCRLIRLDDALVETHLPFTFWDNIVKTVHISFRLLLSMSIGLLLWTPTYVLSQEKSVKPGINDSFLKPNPNDFIERFEIESREIFAQREEIVKACKVEKGMVLADIGAGTGLFSRMFAKEVGPEGKVFAVDIAENFLEHIKLTSRSLGASKYRAGTLLCRLNHARTRINRHRLHLRHLSSL